MCLCEHCGLSQLTYTVPPEILYQNDYPYESSTTKTGVKHYFNFAKSAIERLELHRDDLVVDIGSNVGVLLHGFWKEGISVLGIDPASNIVDIANKKNSFKTICDFFTAKTAKKVAKKYGKASVITGTNVSQSRSIR